MQPRHFYIPFVSTVMVALAPLASRGADVLQNVPGDAQAFVVVKNLAATDAKVSQLLRSLQVEFPGMLTFVKGVTGVSDGLDVNGDFLFVILPLDERAMTTHFCVWLPVVDYNGFVVALGGTSTQSITAVTVAGEDLLVAHHGDWALVMDPDQRTRMEQMLAAAPAPPAQIAAWKTWIDANNATAVAFSSAVRTFLQRNRQTSTTKRITTLTESFEDDIFESNDARQEDDPFAAPPVQRPPGEDIYAAVQKEFQKWLSASPTFQRWAAQTAAVAWGLRLDAEGNALIGLRIASAENLPVAADGQHESGNALPPSLYQGGEFVAYGAGSLEKSMAVPLASAFVRDLTNDLKSEEHLKLDEDTLLELQQAAERAAAEVTSFHVLTRPGEKQEGVYTNNFVVLRATSAADFVAHAAEVMQLWNQLNLDAEGDTRFVFEPEQVMLGNRAARQYSLDIAAADGAPAIPEIRQAMEKFFGPGGKMRLWIVPVDEKTVLLASATTEQVTAALQVLDRNQPIAWTHAELAGVASLLSERADWRFVFSPTGYYNWLRRHTEAMVGTDVIGGPLVKEFAPAPPVGLVGGIRDHDFWVDTMVPAKTIQAAGVHFHK